MTRYELDRLGWYNFEWLVQVLLKAEFGFRTESWGTHKDHGRDAYSPVTMKSRDSRTKYIGPVIIQAKFVAGANATGANYRTSLRAACKAEALSISKRIQALLWAQPKTYILTTNCPVSAADRTEITQIFDRVIDGDVVVHGGADISDLLDLNQEVARTFPQILTYRNLVLIVQAAQNKGILERSSAALAGAEQILPIFVPTRAYERAWTVARAHSFVVLTGPPEMGKTSIGWMIAMAQLANGWEVIECREPDNIFNTFNSRSKQIFLADDAFAQCLQKVDDDHWLI